MRGTERPGGVGTNSIGMPYTVVTVDSIDGDYAMVSDQFFNRRQIDMRIQRGKFAPPKVGETWLIDRALGMWTFAAILNYEDEGGGDAGSIGDKMKLYSQRSQRTDWSPPDNTAQFMDEMLWVQEHYPDGASGYERIGDSIELVNDPDEGIVFRVSKGIYSVYARVGGQLTTTIGDVKDLNVFITLCHNSPAPDYLYGDCYIISTPWVSGTASFGELFSGFYTFLIQEDNSTFMVDSQFSGSVPNECTLINPYLVVQKIGLYPAISSGAVVAIPGPQGLPGTPGATGAAGAAGAQGPPGPGSIPPFSMAGPVASGVTSGRWYAPTNFQPSGALASLKTPGSGTTTAVLMLNGADVGTINISSGQPSNTISFTTPISAFAYLQVRTTAAGSGATDLTVQVY